jgi:hypothetical protein
MFRLKNIDFFYLRGFCKKLVCVFVQGTSDIAREMRLSAVFIGEGVVDAKGRVVYTERKLYRGVWFFFGNIRIPYRVSYRGYPS